MCYILLGRSQTDRHSQPSAAQFASEVVRSVSSSALCHQEFNFRLEKREVASL